MGASYIFICMLSVASGITTAHANLYTKYPFSADLLSDANRGYYTLHWNFSETEKIVKFAVNVSTNGWVGFGISPTGGMVKSDVIIGWINNGASFFQVSQANTSSFII